MRRYSFVQVDVFTHTRFGGNQLAVFPDAQGLSDEEMQTIAREMNYSESTFVLPPETPGTDARVRIFTVVQELQFAGHPTVGTAFVLGRERGKREVTLGLGVGPIRVSVDPGDGMVGSATMEQPLPTFRPAGTAADDIAALLGLETRDVSLKSPAEFGSSGAEFVYLPLASHDAVARARPKVDMMRHLFGESDFNSAYCFALGGQSAEATAHVRVFFPGIGGTLQEDPATGSAAGPFGAYLVRHGLASPGRIVLEQGHEMGRPSRLDVTVEANGEDITGVRVGGGVVFVAEGELVI